MAFKVRKEKKAEMKDLRVSVPLEIFGALEAVSSREGLDIQEVTRQALAYALKKEIKAAKPTPEPTPES